MPATLRRAMWGALTFFAVPAAGLAAQSLERGAVVPLQDFSVGRGRQIPAVSYGAAGIAIGTTDQQIIVFDSVGRELRRLGRAGSGPGELQQLSALGAIQDTLFALDAVRRISSFYPDAPAATRAMQLPTAGALPLRPRLLSGRSIVLEQSAKPNHPLIEANGQQIVRATPDGRMLDTVGALDVRDQVMRIALGPQREVQVFQPFVEIDRLTVSGRGGWLAIIRAPDSRFNPDRSANVIDFVGPEGRNVVKLPARAQPLTDGTVRPWLDAQATDIARFMPGGRSAARRAIAKQLVRPRSHPSVRAAVIGRDGVLWLLQSALDAPRERWTLLAPNGAVLGTVSLPERSRPVVVSGTAAWVVVEREDGEQELVRYRVRR